jgi:hypothetical protein
LTRGVYRASPSGQVIEQSVQDGVQRDNLAFALLATARVSSSRSCGFFSSLWKIRPAAVPVTSWTLRKAVERH